jgi:iron complex outermembrane recepter protein
MRENSLCRAGRGAKDGVRPLRAALLLSACIGSPSLLPAAAGAQSAPVEEVIVTASRAARSGTTAPTPVTTVNADDMKNSGADNIADLLNTQVPSFRASTTPTASNRVTGGGGNVLNLRGLGTARTLVLVDERRHVPTGANETFNLNVIPQAIIDRVEIVTGGASAAWGSDAVAGVVNLIFKKKIEGIEGELRIGGTDKGDAQTIQGSFAFGTSFADERGQFMFASEAGRSRGIARQSDRDWGREGWGLMANPAFTPSNGQPRQLIVPNLHFNLATLGGIILGPSSLIPNGRVQFLPGGVPAPFQPGTITTSSVQSGGDGLNIGQFNTLMIPENRGNAFARSTYDFTDRLQGYAELSYAQSNTKFDVLPTFDLGSLVISRDNAFLPTQIRDQMTALGLSQFIMGRINADFGALQSRIEDRVMRGVLGMKGTFFGDWSWDAYYQYGRAENTQKLANNRIESRFAAAVNSVRDPVTGQLVCVDPSGGCIPVNLFGNGSPSAAAVAWFSGTSVAKTTIVQNVVAGNLRGQPVSTWAGPVSVAAGAEYRDETVTLRVDPLSQAGAFFANNNVPFSGVIKVKELYGEAIVPLARALPLVHAFDLNGAVRYTDYSTSGSVTTWKAGAVYEPFEGVRLRGAYSRDIRAPNANELFSAPGAGGFTTVLDPLTNNSSTIRVASGGNPNLLPEAAKTKTFGFTLSPPWLRGLNASFDWYDIRIRDAIGTLSPQSIINRCAAGESALCAVVQRDPSTNALTGVTASLININQFRTRGEDIDVSYRFPVASIFDRAQGDLMFRVLATHVDKLVTSDGAVSKDSAGSLGPLSAISGVPNWRFTASGTYETGPLTLYLAGRYVGGGKFDKDFTARDINDNNVKSAFYVDATVRYDLVRDNPGSVMVQASVRNLFDKTPPIVPSGDLNGPPTNAIFYDVIGRYMSLSLSVKF